MEVEGELSDFGSNTTGSFREDFKIIKDAKTAAYIDRRSAEESTLRVHRGN
jgi:hypothetical protein